MDKWLEDFVRESNKIEGILREPTEGEILVTQSFIKRPEIFINDMVSLVHVYQPNAELRDKIGSNVRVGDHIAPCGGPDIRDRLAKLLSQICSANVTPYQAHCEYETLHPFTDGNGRSGRALWLWHMQSTGFTLQKLGFLHAFYYQTLESFRQ